MAEVEVAVEVRLVVVDVKVEVDARWSSTKEGVYSSMLKCCTAVAGMEEPAAAQAVLRRMYEVGFQAVRGRLACPSSILVQPSRWVKVGR